MRGKGKRFLSESGFSGLKDSRDWETAEHFIPAGRGRVNPVVSLPPQTADRSCGFNHPLVRELNSRTMPPHRAKHRRDESRRCFPTPAAAVQRGFLRLERQPFRNSSISGSANVSFPSSPTLRKTFPNLTMTFSPRARYLAIFGSFRIMAKYASLAYLISISFAS